MRVLLDTHIALWAIADDDALPRRAREIVEDDTNTLFVSAATIFEIALKNARSRPGPYAMPCTGPEALGFFQDAGFTLLPITPEHAAAVERLPPLHADPVDRLLIAQAECEPMRLLTADRKMLQYGGMTIAA